MKFFDQRLLDISKSTKSKLNLAAVAWSTRLSLPHNKHLYALVVMNLVNVPSKT